jgi:hypothetical protein
LTLNLYGLAISLAYPSEEEGSNLLVQIICTCRHRLRGRGGRGSAPCGSSPLYPLLIPPFSSPLIPPFSPPCPPILMHPCSPQPPPPLSPMFLEEPIGLKQTLEIKNKHSEGYFDSPPLSVVYMYITIYIRRSLIVFFQDFLRLCLILYICTNVYIDIRGGTNISPLCKWSSWKFKA